MAERPLTPRQREVLMSLSALDDPRHWAFWRPMDFGGYDASHHSHTATALVRRGLVERMRFTVGVASGHWRYRITEEGRTAVAKLRGEAPDA